MTNGIVPVIAIVIAFGSLVVASIAAYISWKNAQKQGELTQRLKAQDQDFEKKRFVTALWDKMANLYEIQPDSQGAYKEAHVFDVLNTLELVATCWENNIVDRRIVFLVFGGSFSKRVQEIMSINKPLPKLRKTGTELLHERRLILAVKEDIDKMFANRARRLEGE